MSSRNQRQTIVVIKSLRDVLAKRIPRSSRRYTPSASVIRVRPEEITHRPFVWDLLYAVERSDVIEGIDTGGETSVEAEDLVVDEGCEGEVVE
jgi:hypothetical protein